MERTTFGRPVGILVAALFIGMSLSLSLSMEAEASSTSRVLEITESKADPKEPWHQFDSNPLKLYDIDKDGDKEIIAQNDNDWVYIFDSKSGNMLAEIKNPMPSWWNQDIKDMNGPEVAILEEGTEVRVILVSSASIVSSWVFDRSASSSSNFVLHKEWQRDVIDCGGGRGVDSKPVFADLDRDGRLEIVITTEEDGVYSIRRDGSLHWRQCSIGGGNASAAIADLNQDGFPDVVHASDGGRVSGLNGRSGGYLWSFNVKAHANLGSGSLPVQPGIGQLDGKGGPDIVVGARDSHDTENYENDHAALFAIDSDGKLLWKYQDFEKGNPLTYTRPVVVDTNGDGKNEVYWGDWNTIGHKGGIPQEDSWKRTGPANFYRFDESGNRIWRQTLDTWWSNKDVPLADVDGDGVQEMLANGPHNGQDGIWYLDSRHGGKETFISTAPYKVNRAPVIADLYGGGTMQWVVQVAPISSSAEHAILVYDTHRPYNSAWPHPPAAGTPSGGGTGGGGGGGSGDFDATFSGVGGNEWWIQTQVSTSGGTLSKVDVRLNGGSWKPLEDKGWGWAESYHAPEGTIVQFQATSTGGATDHSGCYRWTSASPTDCPTSGGGGGSGDFDATFSGVGGNEWWIQTQVSTSGGTLSKVDVRLDGGSWKPLEDKGWGWAAPYHAPEGTIVQLRATSTGGATDLSDCYRWTAATKTDCSGSGGSFSVEFDPRAQGNDWWVEVAVSSDRRVVKVDASLNGGSWTALDHTDWGTWAKGMHAPDGTEVRFRATSDTGETAVSSTYVWG